MKTNVINAVYRIAKESLLSAKGDDVLYCLFFSHGLMKAGVTSRGADRLNEILSHGLLTPLLEDFILVSCEGKDKFSAESSALNGLNMLTKRAQKDVLEVFYRADKESVSDIFMSAVSAADNKKNNKLADKDFESVFDDCPSFRGTLLHLARERVFPVAWLSACDYVISREGVSQEEFELGLDYLHWATVEHISEAAKRNAVLIARGASRELRKELLKALVDNRLGKLEVIK